MALYDSVISEYGAPEFLMRDKVINLNDELASLKAEFIESLQHSCQKLSQTLGFNTEELAQCLFCDVLFLLYVNALEDEQAYNIRNDNNILKDSYTGKAIREKTAKYTTYIKCEARYKKLFKNNSSFIKSTIGNWLRVKFRRKRLSYTHEPSIIFAIYILNKVHGQFPDKEKEMKDTLV